jgi:hypothetical protein
LQVADEGGEFLRMPIGHPALEIVTAATGEPRAEQPELMPNLPGTTAAASGRH